MKVYSLFDGSTAPGERRRAGRHGPGGRGRHRPGPGAGRAGRAPQPGRGGGASSSSTTTRRPPGLLQAALGPDGLGCQLKLVRDRVGAQLLLRRQRFDLVLIALDRPDQEAFLRACREHCPESTRFVGIVGLEDEEELARLDALGLDGILHRPARRGRPPGDRRPPARPPGAGRASPDRIPVETRTARAARLSRGDHGTDNTLDAPAGRPATPTSTRSPCSRRRSPGSRPSSGCGMSRDGRGRGDPRRPGRRRGRRGGSRN